MTGETLRYHPSVIVEGMIQIAIFLLILIISAGALDPIIFLAIVVIALAGALVFNYRQWALTTVTFGENEVVVKRETLFKLKKNLPYSKIASVNVNRGLVNRIFGTSKLMININSGHNAITPEASMTFKQDVADRLRAELSARLYGGSVQTETREEEVVPLVRFTTKDVFIHGLFSVPTSQTIMGAILLAYSVFELYISAVQDVQAGGAVLSLIMFFIVQGMPTITNIVHYYNFKVFRKGDIIYLEHGMIRTYRTSFSVHKINAVRVKSTFAARLLRRSSIEAEVVGIGTGDKENRARPVISLLKDKATTQAMFRELLPEFIYERGADKQPREARSALLARAAAASAAVAVLMVYPSWAVYNELAANPVDGIVGAVLPYLLPTIVVLAVIAAFYAAEVSFRVRELDTGESLFTFVNGILDRETVTMSYDKVQMVHITRGPISGLFGVWTAKVHLLSATGTKSISSGLYAEEKLEKINSVVMDRIATGKYDPYKNSI